jgi:putative membrane protein insertion efficiency factor
VTQTSTHPTVARRLRLWPRRAVIFLIELYRSWISPMRMPTCRFEPTCSAYAVDALNAHGLVHGGTLAVVRLLKCGPWHKPGYDPVPERGLRHYLPGGRREAESAVRSTHSRGKG